MDLLDVEPHVGLPLPAAQHQVIHLFRTGARSLQHPALGDALNHLQGYKVTIHTYCLTNDYDPQILNLIIKSQFDPSSHV